MMTLGRSTRKVVVNVYLTVVLRPILTLLGDGLRHYGYQKEKKFYNGVTIEDIHGPDKTNVNGVHGMSRKLAQPPKLTLKVWSEKGIVGRGILVDYHSWAEANGIHKDVFETNAITLEHLKAALEAQGTEVKFADILIIRSGYMASYVTKSRDELIELTKVNPPSFIGVEPSDEVLQWIWENFSAVAGDHPSFECWRKYSRYIMAHSNTYAARQRDPSLHEVVLAGWGCPIGELFDLEKLSEQCKKANRWSFFVASEVCNVSRGHLLLFQCSNECRFQVVSHLLLISLPYFSIPPITDFNTRGDIFATHSRCLSSRRLCVSFLISTQPSASTRIIFPSKQIRLQRPSVSIPAKSILTASTFSYPTDFS
jgi:hypothetical protein